MMEMMKLGCEHWCCSQSSSSEHFQIPLDSFRLLQELLRIFIQIRFTVPKFSYSKQDQNQFPWVTLCHMPHGKMALGQDTYLKMVEKPMQNWLAGYQRNRGACTLQCFSPLPVSEHIPTTYARLIPRGIHCLQNQSLYPGRVPVGKSFFSDQLSYINSPTIVLDLL